MKHLKRSADFSAIIRVEIFIKPRSVVLFRGHLVINNHGIFLGKLDSVLFQGDSEFALFSGRVYGFRAGVLYWDGCGVYTCEIILVF